jgi:Methyltransferase domain
MAFGEPNVAFKSICERLSVLNRWCVVSFRSLLGAFVFRSWRSRDSLLGSGALVGPGELKMAYVNQDDVKLLVSVVEPIPGWLQEYAGKITIALARYQKEIGVSGSFFEIGVYGGKYLSLLHSLAKESGSSTLAIDPFEFFSEEQVLNNIKADSRDKSVKLLKGFSSDFRAYDLLPYLPGRAQFTSLDGAHDCINIVEDLYLTCEVLHPKGIVALDDFINVECLGVNEGVCRFLDRRPGLAPFLFTCGKLFLAHANIAKTYFDFIEVFAAQDTESQLSIAFTNARTHNKKWKQTDFFNFPVLVI